MPPIHRWASSLAALVLAAVLPIAMFAGIMVALLIERQRAMMDADLHETAHAIMAAVDQELAHQIEMVEMLAASPALDAGDLTHFHEKARRAVAESWFTISLSDVEGRTQLLNTALPLGQQAPTLDPDSIRRVAATGKPMIGPVLDGGAVVHEPFLVVRVPVIRDGQVRYVMSVAARPSRLSEIARVGNAQRGELITAVLDPALTIAGRWPDQGFVGHKASPSLLEDAAAGPSTRLRPNVTKEGVEVLTALTQSPATGWWTAVGMTRDAFYAPLRSSAVIIGLGAMAAAAASVALTLRLGRRIAYRVKAEEHEAWDAERKLAAALEASDRAKSRFLAAASHDLRQPFQAMHLYLQVLETMEIEPPKARQAVDALAGAMSAGEELLRALLDVSSFEAGTVTPTMEAIDVAQVIEEVAAEYRPVAERQKLHLRVRGSAAIAHTDRVLVKRMIRNLVNNAFRYTRDGGILIACRRQDGAVLAQVFDTGPGIAADKLELIFEDFYQIDNPARDRSRGLGLGLSIVQRTARLLNHRIQVRSRPGRGSTFTIVMPEGLSPRAIMPTAAMVPAEG